MLLKCFQYSVCDVFENPGNCVIDAKVYSKNSVADLFKNLSQLLTHVFLTSIGVIIHLLLEGVKKSLNIMFQTGKTYVSL